MVNTNLDTTPLPPNNFVAQDPQSAELAGYVRTKTFGRDVRESIARSIELNSTRSKNAEILASETLAVTKTATSNMANQVELIRADKDAVIANATVDSEVILARGGKPTLQARLDETTAQLAQTKNRMKDVSVNILDYGAKSTEEFPYYDSTQAIKDALNTGHNIFIPQGTFLITEPIVLHGDVVIEGVRGRSKIVKNNTVTLTLETFNINSIFIINGSRVSMKDINIVGANGIVNGVTFFNDSFFLSFENVRFQKCNKPFDDIKSVWMTHFDSVHLTDCNVGFDFTSAQEKTSLFFNNCWAENCGSGYEFRSMHYSSLTACGADWVRYKSEDNPYGNGGFGDKSSYMGVYDFTLCRGISLNGIGLENCYGNGGIRSTASSITVNSANIIGLTSEYVPNYINYPNTAVGAIVLEDGLSYLNLNNIYVSSFTNDKIPVDKNKSLFAYNYNESAYGVIDDIIVNIFNLSGAGVRISGSGNHAINVMDYSELKRKTKVYDYIDMGTKRIYAPITMSKATASNKLTIPVTPQSNANIQHMVKISGYDNKSNVTVPSAFNCEIVFSSLTSVNSVVKLNSSVGLEAVNKGSNVEITLPNTYTNMRIEVEVMSNKIDLIDIDNITLS